MENVVFKDLGNMNYEAAWKLQELLLKKNVDAKTQLRQLKQENTLTTVTLNTKVEEEEVLSSGATQFRENQQSTYDQHSTINGHSLNASNRPPTTHYLLFVEHPPVYTLGKSGHMENILISEQEMNASGIEFFRTNRGGDITFHGPGQIVGYPILDLEKFSTDIGKYLRNLEEVIMMTLHDYQLKSSRSPGETGVWLDAGIKGKERKICAMGVRCSRWVTMHGFAFNVNTELRYFDDIIPCGIHDKSVTSLQKELGRTLPLEEVKEKVKRNFETVFNVTLSTENS